jgi:hypothetical protein
MNKFMKALVSEQRNLLIPEDKDYFGHFIGEWDFIWNDRIGTSEERFVKGEWIFSRVLNGTGIQDLFICPSREERVNLQEQGEEYGTTIRLYNPSTGNWEVYYCCLGEYTRLEAVKEEGKIVLTEKEQGRMKWIFSEIEDNSFHWQNVMLDKEGMWVVRCDCRAVRRA